MYSTKYPLQKDFFVDTPLNMSRRTTMTKWVHFFGPSTYYIQNGGICDKNSIPLSYVLKSFLLPLVFEILQFKEIFPRICLCRKRATAPLYNCLSHIQFWSKLQFFCFKLRFTFYDTYFRYCGLNILISKP